MICAGQGTTSRLVGVVTDPTGAAIASASVRLKNEGTGAQFKTETSIGGAYTFEAVQPGRYEVSIETAGFRKFVSSGNTVTIGQPTTVNIRLELGNVTETVSVSGSAEAVQTSTSSNIGNIMAEQTIRDLPIVGTRGRNPVGLVDLQPGVIDTQAISGGAVIVFGARDRAWNFTLDGIDNNESSSGGSDFAPLRTNPDSLSEFRVITSNPSAEYGRSSGAQVAMITKSGSNDFHGGLFEFYRTPRFNANEWQNNYNSIGKAQFVQNIYGGDLGGPVFKNKTFFFFNFQGLAARSSAATTRLVYTAQARQGIFRYVVGGKNGPAGTTNASVDANGNVLPNINVASYNIGLNDPAKIGLDKTTAALATSAPLPNKFDYANGDGLNIAGYAFGALSQERQHDVTFKIDQIINAKNTVYARVSWGQQNTNCDGGNGGYELFPGTGCQVNTLRDPKNMAYNWRWNPTARLTNELVFGLNMFGFIFDQPPADLNKLSFAASGAAPIAVPAADFGNSRKLKTWQVVDNLAYQWGNHSLKFGTNLRFGSEIDSRGSVAAYNATTDVYFTADIDNTAFGIPASTMNSTDLTALRSSVNFLLGRVGEIQRGFSAPDGQKFVTGLLPFTAQWNEYDFYGQDSWKVNRNLTVDLGLRWEIKMAPTSDQVMSHPNQPLVFGAPATNAAQWVRGNLFNNSYGNIGPSIGLAWDPFGTGKTSIRSNYRIAYDRLNSFLFSSQVFNNQPGYAYGYDNTAVGQQDTRVSTISAAQPPAGVSPSDFTKPAAFSSGSISAVDPNLKFATTHQWAFSIQREVWKGGVIEADYIGRRGYHLLGAYNANQPNIFASGYIDAFNTVKAGGQSDLLNTLFAGDSRIATGKTESDVIRSNYASALSLGSYASILNTLGTRVQGTGAAAKGITANPFAVIPFTQYTGGVTTIDSNDYSTYNGLVLQAQQHWKSGINFQASYTWSKNLSTRDFDPTFTVYSTANSQGASSTPFDLNNRKLNYGPAQSDHRHALQAHGTFELPFGRGKTFANALPGAFDRVVGGWELSPVLTVYSGRPLTAYSGAYTFQSVVQSTVNCNGCSSDFGKVQDYQGYKWFFNPDDIKAKMSTPAVGSFGNTGKGYFTGPKFFDMDLALLKRTRVTEKVDLEFRADAINLTNSPSFGPPTLTYTSSTFGRIGGTVESGSRKVQLGLKLNF